jgi:hypothetical protein
MSASAISLISKVADLPIFSGGSDGNGTLPLGWVQTGAGELLSLNGNALNTLRLWMYANSDGKRDDPSSAETQRLSQAGISVFDFGSNSPLVIRADGSPTANTFTTQSLQNVHGATTSADDIHASNQTLAHGGRAQAAINFGALTASSSGLAVPMGDACLWRNSRYPSANKYMQIRSINSEANRVANRYSCATNFEDGMHRHPANQGIWRFAA